MPVLIIMFKGVIGDIVSPITNNNAYNTASSAAVGGSNANSQYSNTLILNPSSHTFYSGFRKESFLNSSF